LLPSVITARSGASRLVSTLGQAASLVSISAYLPLGSCPAAHCVTALRVSLSPIPKPLLTLAEKRWPL
jgi:hypothetical protein